VEKEERAEIVNLSLYSCDAIYRGASERVPWASTLAV